MSQEVQGSGREYSIALGPFRFTSVRPEAEFAESLETLPQQILHNYRPTDAIESEFIYSAPEVDEDGSRHLQLISRIYLRSGSYSNVERDVPTMLDSKLSQIFADSELAESVGFHAYPAGNDMWHTSSNETELEVLIGFDEDRGTILLTNSGFFNDENGNETFLPAPDLRDVPALSALTAFLSIHAFLKSEIVKQRALGLEALHESLGKLPLMTATQLEIAPKVPHSNPSRLNELGGLRREKELLQDIKFWHQHPKEAAEQGITPVRSILLYGVPGTGKTSLVEAFAADLGASLIKVRSEDIVDRWNGESGKRLKAKFDEAKVTDGPIVLFFDELDSIIPSQNSIHSPDQQVHGVFKTQMDELAKGDYPNVIVAATTNSPQLGPAATRRFEAQQNIGLPDQEDRSSIWATLIDKTLPKVSLPSLQIANLLAAADNANQAAPRLGDTLNARELAVASEGLSGADMTIILQAVQRKNSLTSIRTGTKILLEQQHILDAIQTFKIDRSR